MRTALSCTVVLQSVSQNIFFELVVLMLSKQLNFVDFRETIELLSSIAIDKDGNGEITSEEMGAYIRSFNDGHEEELENVS